MDKNICDFFNPSPLVQSCPLISTIKLTQPPLLCQLFLEAYILYGCLPLLCYLIACEWVVVRSLTASSPSPPPQIADCLRDARQRPPPPPPQCRRRSLTFRGFGSLNERALRFRLLCNARHPPPPPPPRVIWARSTAKRCLV